MKVMPKAIFIILFLLTSPYALQAGESAALSTKYTERVPARFGHGFMNTVFGWTELGLAPYHAIQDGKGGGDAFGRALTQPFATTYLGIWDLLTFWVPGETGRTMAVPRHVWMAPPNPSTEASPQDASAMMDSVAEQPALDVT